MVLNKIRVRRNDIVSPDFFLYLMKKTVSQLKPSTIDRDDTVLVATNENTIVKN